MPKKVNEMRDKRRGRSDSPAKNTSGGKGSGKITSLSGFEKQKKMDLKSGNDGPGSKAPKFQDADAFIGAQMDSDLHGASEAEFNVYKGKKSPSRPSVDKGSRGPGSPKRPKVKRGPLP